jgi:hypothetical protein
MTETNRIQTLVATLRSALEEMESELGLMREGVDAIGQAAAGLREGLPDAQADRESLEAEVEDEDAGDV